MLTILLEGLYQSIAHDSPLKQTLLQLRTERWSNHFGVPSIHFLLTHDACVQQIRMCHLENIFPVNNFAGLSVDESNQVLISPHVTVSIPTPASKEMPGHFTQTHYPQGGFTTAPSDPYSQQFIQHALNISKLGGVKRLKLVLHLAQLHLKFHLTISRCIAMILMREILPLFTIVS